MRKVFGMHSVVYSLLFTLTMCAAPTCAHDELPESHRQGVNAAMVAQAEVWLSLLAEEHRNLACFPFESDERLNWHFVPRERLGLPLKDMNLKQRRAAYRLMQTGLSHQGYLKVTTIMSLESVLREIEKDDPVTKIAAILKSTGSQFLYSVRY